MMRIYENLREEHETLCIDFTITRIIQCGLYAFARQLPRNKQRYYSLCQAAASAPIVYLEKVVFCGFCADGCASSNGYNNGNGVFCAVRTEVIQVRLTISMRPETKDDCAGEDQQDRPTGPQSVVINQSSARQDRSF
jgi:hypothetical protein